MGPKALMNITNFSLALICDRKCNKGMQINVQKNQYEPLFWDFVILSTYIKINPNKLYLLRVL